MVYFCEFAYIHVYVYVRVDVTEAVRIFPKMLMVVSSAVQDWGKMRERFRIQFRIAQTHLLL